MPRSSTPSWLLWAAPAALAAALAAVGCGGNSGSSDSTQNTTGGGGSGGSGGAGGTAGMAGSGGAPPATARDYFEQVVYPAMKMPPDGCDGCHNIEGSAPYPFLGNPDGVPSPYDAISTYQGIIVKDPTKSVLVVYPSSDAHGAGQAPTISDSLKTLVLKWLKMEAENLPESSSKFVYQVKPFKPILGGALNTIYLDEVDPSLKYASVSFNAKLLADDLLQLKNLEVHPIEGQTIHVVHPLFTVYPQKAVPEPDPVDSFAGTDQSFTLESPSLSLGTGELIITNWKKEAYLGMAFELIKNEGGGGSASTCKDVAKFQAEVVPQLAYCAENCHGGKNVQANATMDLSKLMDMPPDAACAQVRARITPGDPETSQILIVTNPTELAVHMYKFMGSKTKYAAFKEKSLPGSFRRRNEVAFSPHPDRRALPGRGRV